MTTIVLPPEVDGPLAEQARKRGMTPELLAIDYLRERFVLSPPVVEAGGGSTLYHFLSGYIGTIDGTTEARSEKTDQGFVEGLVEKDKRGHS